MESINRGQKSISTEAIFEETEMKAEDRNALLKEYEIGHQHAWKWDQATWQTAAIFLPASLAGLIVVAQISGFSPSKFPLVFIIAISSIVILFAWLRMIKHWNDCKYLMYFRLREIERDLGLWKNLYFASLNEKKEEVAPDLAFLNEKKRARLEKLSQLFPQFSGRMNFSFIRMTTIGIIILWTVLLLYIFIFTFLI